MSYQDGFQDGVTFAREVIINNLRKWAEDATGDEGSTIEAIADKIEFGKLDNDA